MRKIDACEIDTQSIAVNKIDVWELTHMEWMRGELTHRDWMHEELTHWDWMHGELTHKK